MSIKRVASIFSNSPGERFKILYGPGVDDIFYSKKIIELKFEEALYEELIRQGFDRIVFFSPHRSIFFFDSQSELLSLPDHNHQIINHKSRSSDNVKQLYAGPLNDIKIFKTSLSKDITFQGGISDPFAVRVLDKIIREEGNVRSAIIILQAETTFRYFEDQRTFAGLVGDWTKLPSSNHNVCFFVFSVENYEHLIDVAGTIPIPELRNPILKMESDFNKLPHINFITTPDEQEIHSLVEHYHRISQIKIELNDFEILCHRMAAEKHKNRYWLALLEEIPVFDLATSREKAWFSAHLDSDINVWQKLDQLVGLEQVKNRIRELTNWLNILQQRKQNGNGKVEFPSLHMIFSGNPGTGKTTVARLFGEILFEIGLLQRGHLIEARSSDLIADHIGGTALKTNRIIDRALDGVLFIDEAYMLSDEGIHGFGQEAIDTILARMENDRSRLVIICAGYPDLMDQFRRSNPGLERRFPQENIIFFDDFNKEQLEMIFDQLISEKGLSTSHSFHQTIIYLISELYARRDKNFGNAGEIRNLVESLDRLRASRIALTGIDQSHPLELEDIPPSYSHLLPQKKLNHEQIFLELDALVGLQEVKNYIQNMVYRLEFDSLRYASNNQNSSRPKLQHMVFLGNPGTGKTTVARLVGNIYQSLGLLRRGHCIEVTRVDLVAGYVGQTAQKTMVKVRDALDGVLFIDEAYTLVNDQSSGFGHEAIDTLVKAMEEYQSRLVVIIAGYPNEVNQLLKSNPGLLSRFGVRLEFNDYSFEDLTEILVRLLIDNGFVYPDEVLVKARKYLENEKQRYRRYFGNARSVLSLFETIQSRLAQRVVPLADGKPITEINDLLNTILPEDIPEPEAYIFT
jgi:SpoVK/Ycf46/Vps4 family AAA+-type ATPase